MSRRFRVQPPSTPLPGGPPDPGGGCEEKWGENVSEELRCVHGPCGRTSHDTGRDESTSRPSPGVTRLLRGFRCHPLPSYPSALWSPTTHDQYPIRPRSPGVSGVRTPSPAPVVQRLKFDYPPIPLNQYHDPEAPGSRWTLTLLHSLTQGFGESSCKGTGYPGSPRRLLVPSPTSVPLTGVREVTTKILDVLLGLVPENLTTRGLLY